MSAVLPSNLCIEERWFKFHIFRACEKAYTNESLRRNYLSLLLEVSAEWKSCGAFDSLAEGIAAVGHKQDRWNFVQREII